MYHQVGIPEEVSDPKKIIPREMPDLNEQEKTEVSIIPAPKIDLEEEDDYRESKGYILENRLEHI